MDGLHEDLSRWMIGRQLGTRERFRCAPSPSCGGCRLGSALPGLHDAREHRPRMEARVAVSVGMRYSRRRSLDLEPDNAVVAVEVDAVGPESSPSS